MKKKSAKRWLTRNQWKIAKQLIIAQKENSLLRYAKRCQEVLA